MATLMGKQSVAVRFLAFAMIAGLIGGFVSVMMRAELAHSGMQFFASGKNYNVFVTLHGFLLIYFSLLPALFFGFGEISLGLRSEGAGKLSRRIVNTILALLVLAFMVFLYSAFIEYDIRGRNGVGGGWTAYAPLSTTGKPENIFSFLSLGMDLGLLALLLVLAAILLGILRYYSLLFFHAGAIPKSYAPLVWSIALAFLGALLLMPYHVYILSQGGVEFGGTVDPVYTKTLLEIMETGYTSLLFIVALGLASTIALSGQTQSGILVKGMVFLIVIYAGLEIFSLGWVSFCQIRVLGCRSVVPYQGWIVGAKVLSAVLLFLLWIFSLLRGREGFVIWHLWVYAIVIFNAIAIFMPISLGQGRLLTVFEGTTYEVAHFHFLTAMPILFSLFAGVYYGFPHLVKGLYKQRLGHLQFWIMFIGVLLCFIPQIILGQAGMARAIPDYPDMFGSWNMVSSIGSYVIAFGFVLFLLLLGLAYKEQQRSI